MAVQYQLTEHSSAALAESIERSIRQGDIGAGELLTPVRQLAAEIGMSAGTVAAAYRLLAARGLTVSDRRRGTRVRPRRAEGAPARQGLPVPEGVVDCSSGNPDRSLLPDVGAALARLAYEPARYGSPVVHPRLGAEAGRRFESDGIDPANLTVTFGALDAISRMLSTNLAPGDRVAVEDPGWASLIDSVERLGYHAVAMPVDAEGPTAEGVWQALAGGSKAVVITSRSQNPTGAAITPARAADLRGILARYPGRLLIEDDHACGLVECDLSVLGDVTGRHGFVRSFAKGYGQDLRLAVVAGDSSTIGRLEASTVAGAGWVSHLNQQVALALWSDPEVALLLERAAAAYRERRSALCSALADRGTDVPVPSAGLNVWIPVEDEASVVSAMQGEGWLVAPGGRFRLSSSPAIRVTTAALPVELAGECAAAIAAAMAGGGRARALA